MKSHKIDHLIKKIIKETIEEDKVFIGPSLMKDYESVGCKTGKENNKFFYLKSSCNIKLNESKTYKRLLVEANVSDCPGDADCSEIAPDLVSGKQAQGCQAGKGKDGKFYYLKSTCGGGDKGTGDKGTGDKGTGDKGTGDKGTGDKGTATPIGALPKWVDNHACLKGAQPIAQGDNIIIEYQGQKFSLSSDQKAVDVNDSAFTGTWQCVTPTSLKIYTSAVRSSGNVVSGGDGGNKGGGACTEDMFPDCVRGLKMAEEQCAILGYAKTTDLREYQIRYLSQKAIGPDQMEQYRCWIYVNGWKGGYYTCGASGPIITSDIGQLYGTNKGSYSQISSKDRAGNVSRLNTIKDFIWVNDEGTQITRIDRTKLRQIVYEVQNLVRDGYRGAAIGELIEYLQEVEELLNTNFNQEKETITTALTDINNVVNNFKKEDFDPNYVVDLDPPSGVIASYETENPKFANTYLNKNFTVYRNPAFLNRASMDAGTSSAAGKVKEKGFNKESCKNYLENYLISIDLGRLVGRNDVTGYKDDEIIKLTPQWIAGIKKCANNDMYKRGILGNQDYQKAIDYLNNLPVEKGGIKL